MKRMISFFKRPLHLSRAGILGINRRNAEFILPMNPRAHYPLVDNKLATKSICQKAGIPVPETFGMIQHHFQINTLSAIVAKTQAFVIKPARGASGRGVMVITRRTLNHFESVDAHKYDLGDVSYHISSILSGLYSLGGRNDTAIIEHRIVPHSEFKRITLYGTPDIRVIVLNGHPVMAMVRLPTSCSRGRANLHQGAVAAGIDLRTGLTTQGVLNNRKVTDHPDTKTPLKGVFIPYFDEMLALSAKLYPLLKLGYFGVDFVIDEHLGPLVLEANARPGLSIQIANGCGLLKRLQQLGGSYS